MRRASVAAVRLGYPGEMALQWTPLRRRGGAMVRARQNIETLEHQTQANILLAFKLSMVSGNGVNSVPRPSYRTYRKMADAEVQYEPQDTELNGGVELEPSAVNRTVAEINTSAEIAELDTTPAPIGDAHPSLHRPLSLQSSTSSSSSGNSEERGERRRNMNSAAEEVDIDAIHVQQSVLDDLASDKEKKKSEKTEPDGFAIQEKDESSCGVDCLYFTMQCCECTIL